jgi:hypothetical protein
MVVLLLRIAPRRIGRREIKPAVLAKPHFVARACERFGAGLCFHAFRRETKKEGDDMKHLTWIALALLLIPAAGRAQDQQVQQAQPVANPVSSNIKQQLAHFSKIMVAAADSMPADKFNYSPTPQQMTFAHLTAHIATSNTFLCSKISGTPAPDLKLADTDPKDQLVAGLKASFDYCTTALAAVDDSKLGQPIMLFGNHPNTIAGAMISITNDWADHYSTQAGYLRLNGILPPTAQPAPAK